MNLLKKIKFHALVPLAYAGREILGINQKEQKAVSDESLIFILGSGRNGSTLLALLLNRHSDIHLPPEQYALPYSIMDSYLPVKWFWKRFTKKHLGNYEKIRESWQFTPQDFDEVRSKVNPLLSDQRNPANIFRILFKHHAMKQGKKARLLGDHSPLNTEYYKYVSQSFPNEKYIVLMRHPLDVVLSFQKLVGHKATDPAYAAWRWNNGVAAYDYLRKKHQVLLVKYEDLTAHPEKQMDRVFNFLGVKNQHVITGNTSEKTNDALGIGDLDFHNNLYKPINTSAVGKWKKDLDQNIISSLSPILQQNAQRFGYQLSKDK